ILGSLQTVTTLSAMSTLCTPVSANKLSTRGDPAARSLLSKKKGPPGCTIRLTANLHVSGSASDISARMPIGRSTGSPSDIFGNLSRSALAESPQMLERIDPAVMPVVPIHGDGVVANAGDAEWRHVKSDALWVENRSTAHFFPAERAVAPQS